jgi:hypothetical protein
MEECLHLQGIMTSGKKETTVMILALRETVRRTNMIVCCHEEDEWDIGDWAWFKKETMTFPKKPLMMKCFVMVERS